MTGDPIADLRSPAGSLISVFVDRPSPGGFGALLTDLVRPLKEKSVNLARDVRLSVRNDSHRIHALAPRLEAESAPAYAMFASELDDLFLLEPLAYPTSSVSTIGPRPYMRPLRAARRGLRSGLLVADRTRARTFISYEGLVEELSDPISIDIGKHNYGGFGGYAEHGNRAYADEASAKLWREAGWRLLEEHQERPLDYMAIGGHGETIDEIGRLLHPYLGRLQRTTFVAEPKGVTLVRLRSVVRTQDIEMRRGRQSALAGRVCDTAWGGGSAVLGLGPVLDAVNAQAIDTLVVAGEFQRDGSMCNQCGHLARDGAVCPVCESPMFGVDDVVGAVMDATVSAGGTVSQISVASALDSDGVGALTRFPVAV